jgi:predicted DNA-binding transcriptional regulator AlpA
VLPASGNELRSSLGLRRHLQIKVLQLVEDGQLPQPKNIGRPARWDRLDLDAIFDAAEEKRLPGTRVTMDDIVAKNSWNDFMKSRP